MSNDDMENFLDLFPKGRDKIRLTQEIILTDIKKELDKGTKFIIAEAPTGTGNIVRIVGYVISGSTNNGECQPSIYFNPDNTWIEVA